MGKLLHLRRRQLNESLALCSICQQHPQVTGKLSNIIDFKQQTVSAVFDKFRIASDP